MDAFDASWEGRQCLQWRRGGRGRVGVCACTSVLPALRSVPCNWASSLLTCSRAPPLEHLADRGSPCPRDSARVRPRGCCGAAPWQQRRACAEVRYAARSAQRAVLRRVSGGGGVGVLRPDAPLKTRAAVAEVRLMYVKRYNRCGMDRSTYGCCYGQRACVGGAHAGAWWAVRSPSQRSTDTSSLRSAPALLGRLAAA